MGKRKDKIAYYRKDPSGEYAYIGKYLRWQGDEASYRKELQIWFASCGLIFAAHLALGFVTETGMEGNPFMLIPYAATLLTVILLLWKLVRLWKTKGTIKEYENDEIVKAIPWFTLFILLFCICEVAGVIQTFVSHREYLMGKAGFLYPIMAVFSAFLSYLIFRRRKAWEFG